MKYFRLKHGVVHRLTQGQRLISLEDFQDPTSIQDADEGMVILLTDSDKSFQAQALVGRQNKGFAWVFSMNESLWWSAELIDHWLTQALEKRHRLLACSDTNAFRLFNGEGDGLGGVTIDYYDHFIQINWYSRGAYLYKEWWYQALMNQTRLSIQGIYETKRFELADKEIAMALVSGQAHPEDFFVKEAGRYYRVQLGEDWMTGLFLDQRQVRQFVQDQSDQMTVLNLFSYTGAFTVAAAQGGASRTVSVDVANRSLALTQANLAANHLDTIQDQHKIRIMDVFDYLQYAKRKELQFDMLICDPPSFARTKERTFSALSDYRQLAADLFTLTRPGGMCILSTNHSAYLKETFIEEMNEAGQLSGSKVHLIQTFGLPEDFPSTADKTSQYLKVLVYYRSE